MLKAGYTSCAEEDLHARFKQMLLNAQIRTDSLNKEIPVKWKTYRASVKPNKPTFTEKDLEKALKNAIKQMSASTPSKSNKNVVSQSILQESISN